MSTHDNSDASDNPSDNPTQSPRSDRDAILARRARFVAAALTGLTTSTLATACPCLKLAAPPSTEEPEPADAEPEHGDDGDPVEQADPAGEHAPPPASDDSEQP